MNATFELAERIADATDAELDGLVHQFWKALPGWVTGGSLSLADARFLFRAALDANSKAPLVSANELVIPAGRPIRIHLRTVDVIHSFWVPKLAGKVDMIPNRANHMWVKADKPAYFWGQCAEYCGMSHANMRLRIPSRGALAREAVALRQLGSSFWRLSWFPACSEYTAIRLG